MLKNVIFLDRDGVINRDSSQYVKSWEEFSFIPRSLQALQLLSDCGFPTIVITNQSAINRRITSKEKVEDIHAKMLQAVINFGGEIRGVYYCPHTPAENCTCRKPKPGLIHKARQTLCIDLASSIMVGDSAKDIQCAKNAGCGASVLVHTGNGREAEKILTKENKMPDYIAEDLYSAVEWIVSRR